MSSLTVAVKRRRLGPFATVVGAAAAAGAGAVLGAFDADGGAVPVSEGLPQAEFIPHTKGHATHEHRKKNTNEPLRLPW